MINGINSENLNHASNAFAILKYLLIFFLKYVIAVFKKNSGRG